MRTAGNEAHLTEQLAAAQDHGRAVTRVQVHLAPQHVEDARGVSPRAKMLVPWEGVTIVLTSISSRRASIWMSRNRGTPL